MGYASYLIWKVNDEDSTNALIVYAGSLTLNFAFTPIFFGSKKLFAVRIFLNNFRFFQIQGEPGQVGKLQDFFLIFYGSI